MTYEEIKDVFGTEDRYPSEMLFRLSVTCPSFGFRDLLDIFESVCDEYHGSRDVSPRVLSSSTTKNVMSWLNFVNRHTYFSSDIVFRNLYRIMFETSEWDDAMLFKPEFIEDFCSFALSREPRRENHGPGDAQFNRALDLWEKLMEFKDRLVEKVRLASGA